ncbi:MAG: DNRLRE domain-containing protein, partial [Methanobacteriota archaeon]
GANFNESESLGVSAFGRFALLSFPIDRLPRNTTLVNATLVLVLREPPSAVRTLGLFRVAEPWSEERVNFSGRPGRADAPDVTVETDFVGGARIVEFNMTPTLVNVYANGTAWHGVAVADVGGPLPLGGGGFQFFSSNRSSALGADRPALFVTLVLHAPEPDGPFFGESSELFARPGARVPVSARVFDPAGGIRVVRVNATNETGVGVLNETLSPTGPGLYSAEVLLPDAAGNYTMEVVAEDEEGTWNATRRGTPQVHLETTPPALAAPAVLPAEPEAAAEFNLTIGASDPSGAAAASARIVENATGLLVGNFSMTPVGPVADPTRAFFLNGSLERPGLYDVTFFVSDRAGNVGNASFAFRVRTFENPVFEST